MTFDNVEAGVAYSLKDNVSVYGLVRLDKDFEYDETVVGIAVTFYSFVVSVAHWLAAGRHETATRPDCTPRQNQRRYKEVP